MLGNRSDSGCLTAEAVNQAQPTPLNKHISRAVRITFTGSVMIWVLVRGISLLAGFQPRWAAVIFVVLDIVTVWPYTEGIYRTALGLHRRQYKLAAQWTAIGMGAFLLPYAFLLLVGRDFPTWAFGLTLGWICLILILAIRRVIAIRAKLRIEETG